MEAKKPAHARDVDDDKTSAKEDEEDTHDMHDDDDKTEAPASNVVALRHGYNQTYIIRSSSANLHDVLFRCGNWCYGGKVDLGSATLGLSDLPAVIPALQKQQGSLQYLCEWKWIPASSPYAAPLEKLYDAFDFIGAELGSASLERKLLAAAKEHRWIDADDDVKNFFELQTGGYECFDDVDIVASRTFVRELVLLVVYYRRSFYVVLQDGSSEQPLLDVRFPDLSTHLQGVHLRTYNTEDNANMKKLTLWQATSVRKQPSPPKPIRVECKDVSGEGYNQTFLIRRTNRGTGPCLREVLFRFGNWCYNGHVDLGPKLGLADIPVIIPMLRRQQNALTFMCEVSKMPATSLFTPAMEYLAEAIPGIQHELSRVEQVVRTLGEDVGARVGQWLKDDDADYFFEIGLDKSDVLRDVEAIACKVHLSDVVLVILYYDFTMYVYVESGENDQPLLDSCFPNVAFQKEGVQLQTYRDGIAGCAELRRISMWRVGDEEENEDDDMRKESRVAHHAAPTRRAESADAKQHEQRREEDVKTSGDSGDLEAKMDGPRKSSVPHHIAPLKAGLAPVGKQMPELAMKAPWDETGRPLGFHTAK